jgi:hypothetical protein
MKRFIAVLCATVTMLGLSIFVSSTAFAGGPPEDVNLTANMSFSIVKGHFEVDCYYGHTMNACMPTDFGRISAPGGNMKFTATPGYAIPVGRILYAARGHADRYSPWFGASTPVYITRGGVKYHVTGGYVGVLKAQG